MISFEAFLLRIILRRTGWQDFQSRPAPGVANRSCLVAQRLLIAIAKGATELRIAPNWHPKAIGRIAV